MKKKALGRLPTVPLLPIDLAKPKKKKEKNLFSMYEIVCFVGSDKIYITKIDSRGRIERQLKSIDPKGRIVSISKDRWLKRGTLLLTDSSDETYIPQYKVINDFKLLFLTPPSASLLLPESAGQHMGLALKAIKYGKIFKLLNNRELMKNGIKQDALGGKQLMLTPDSHFEVIKANTEAFTGKNKDDAEEEEADSKAAAADQDKQDGNIIDVS